MKNPLRRAGMLLLCICLAISGLSADDADPFSYANGKTDIMKRLGHYAYWNDIHMKIHKPFSQMTRIECGWNYYLRSLVDPIYEEAEKEIGKTTRVTTDSNEVDLKFMSFNPQTRTFDFKLTFYMGLASVETDVSIPYKNVTGRDWPGNDAPYRIKTYAQENANRLSQVYRNNGSSLLMDITYHISYNSSSRSYILNIDNLDVYRKDTKELVYSSLSTKTKTFNIWGSIYDSYAGDVPFDLNVLDKTITATNPRLFSVTANPFGLSSNYTYLNRQMDTMVVAETKEEIERLHEEEKLRIKELEDDMREEALIPYRNEVRKIEAQQKKEEQKQAEYDKAFKAESERILSQTPYNTITWNDKIVENPSPYYSAMNFGIGFNAGTFEGEFRPVQFILNGSIQHNFGESFGNRESSLFIDAYAAGPLDGLMNWISSKDSGLEDFNSDSKALKSIMDTGTDSSNSGSIEDIKPTDPYFYDEAFTLYLGLGPAFSNSVISFLLSGGLAVGMENTHKGEYIFCEPAIKLSLTMVNMDPFGFSAAALIRDTSVQTSIFITGLFG